MGHIRDGHPRTRNTLGEHQWGASSQAAYQSGNGIQLDQQVECHVSHIQIPSIKPQDDGNVAMGFSVLVSLFRLQASPLADLRGHNSGACDRSTIVGFNSQSERGIWFSSFLFPCDASPYLFGIKRFRPRRLPPSGLDMGLPKRGDGCGRPGQTD